MARSVLQSDAEGIMELIVAVGALATGLVLSLAAGRLLVAGVIAVTFGATSPAHKGGVNVISSPPGALSTTPVSSSMASTA
jgi:hypothetical protein